MSGPEQISVTSGTEVIQGRCDELTLPPKGQCSTLTNDPARNIAGHNAAASVDARSAASLVDKKLQIGRYDVLEEIARGGMGVVYKALDRQLERIVALKLTKAGELADDQEVQRFRVGALVAANLEHPGIVPVYEAGWHGNQPFLAMAFVDGQSLSDQLNASPMKHDEAVRIMLIVAEAVEYAHSKGIIHRDLKPQNIMMTKDGHPKVTDFDLAKRQQNDSSLTANGDVLGTPSYMPPEQVSGNCDAVGPSSDVYSLGATFYCLLTGRPPFQAATPMDTLMQVLEQEPVPPRLLNSAIPVELEAICFKCLAKSPGDRYASCQELRDDLHRFSCGEPVSVRHLNWGSTLLRAVQHNRDDVHLQKCSVMLAWCAAIVFVTEFVLQFLDRTGPFAPFVVVRGSQFLAFGAVAFQFRREFLFAAHPSVAQVRNLSMSFVLACCMVFLTQYEQQLLLKHDRSFEYYYCYPAFLVLSGFFFLALGRQYWGVCYVIGVSFMALSVGMPLMIEWAPIVFGLAWSTTLALISWRFRSLQINNIGRP